MRFHVFLLAAVATALVTPQSDISQRDADIAQLKEVVQRIKDRAPQTPPPASGGGGIAGTLSDVTTLLTGLSDSLTGACNLRSDIAGLLNQLSSLGL